MSGFWWVWEWAWLSPSCWASPLIGEQTAVDQRDNRLAIRVLLDCVERMLVTDKKRYGLPDVKKMLKDIELARDAVSDDE